MGSGKTTTGKLFQKLGAYVIDADILAKHVLDSSYERYDYVTSQINKKFSPYVNQDDHGQIFIDGGKTIDRQKIAHLVFSKKELLTILEEIIHPEVNQIFKKKIINVPVSQIIIYDVPLLFEKQLDKKLKATILVYAPEKIALERARHRTGLSESAIKARIQTQISIEKKKQMTDYVIDNTGKPDNLTLQVRDVWNKISKEKQ